MPARRRPPKARDSRAGRRHRAPTGLPGRMPTTPSDHPAPTWHTPIPTARVRFFRWCRARPRSPSGSIPSAGGRRPPSRPRTTSTAPAAGRSIAPSPRRNDANPRARLRPACGTRRNRGPGAPGAAAGPRRHAARGPRRRRPPPPPRPRRARARSGRHRAGRRPGRWRRALQSARVPPRRSCARRLGTRDRRCWHRPQSSSSCSSSSPARITPRSPSCCASPNCSASPESCSVRACGSKWLPR